MPSDCCYFVDKAAAAGAAPALNYFGSILHCPAVFTQNLGQTRGLLLCTIRAFFTHFKKVWIFCLSYSLASKTMNLGFLSILCILFSCIFHLLEFEFANDNYIIDATFDLNDIFMYRVIWSGYS